jgi:hypothetical protein
VPVARDTNAPQWATPPGPKPTEPPETEHPAAAEPMHAPEAAPEPLAAAPQWSPVVPLTTHGDSDAERVEPTAQPRAPWRPVVPTSAGDQSPQPTPVPPTPAPEPPTEPPPPLPTEPEPPPPAALTEPGAAPARPEDDAPWWDAEPSRNDR